MHKQLRLKPLKKKQMGSIFHLWICFIGYDEYEMPEGGTSAEMQLFKYFLTFLTQCEKW